ncbi:MAG: hypothetical protein PHC88_06365 [Terrimicrobiaceae bacterium]|nr:hypothetical protein [Terrimicrobiaceae bacterium]
MKNRLLPLTIAPLLALAQPAMAQEKPASSPTPTPVPASPALKSTVASTPAPAASPAPTAPAKADASSAATPEAKESIAPGSASAPSPSPAGKSDADYLPEPTDSSLGAPVESKDESLPSGEAAPSDLPNPDNLIPQGPPGAEGVPPAPPKVAENKFDVDRKLAVRYQEVKLLALKDEAIRSLHEQAEAAKTDEGKRQAMRAYFRLLFAKMTSIDAKLKVKCDLMEEAYLRRLGQFRVEPTIPLNPPPTPAPLAN